MGDGGNYGGGGGGRGKRDGGGRGGGGDRGGRGGGGKRARYAKYSGGGGSGGGGNASAIPQGARGLLVTCDSGRERRCGDEIAALVEGAFERLETTPAGAAAAAPPSVASIDARLAAEVAALRDPRKERFRYYDTGVRGTFFLAFPSPFREPGAPGPVAVAVDLVERARREGRSGSRFAQRLVPVERTCFGGLEELAAMALDVAKDHFGAEVLEEEEKEEEKEAGKKEGGAEAAAAEGGDKNQPEQPPTTEAEEEGKEGAEADPVEEKKDPPAKPEAGDGDGNADAAAAAAAAAAPTTTTKATTKKPPPAPIVLPKAPRTTARDGTKPLSFAVDVDSRACGRITRAHAIDVVAAPVPCPPHRVDLTKPDATIVVQCVRNAATAAVVPRYRELMRLNLARAAQAGAEEMAAAAGGEEEEAGAAAATAKGEGAAAAAAAEAE
jgi:hypothetical protein